MSESRPRLRYLEVFPITEEGRTSILLRDPWRIGERAIVVTPEFFTLLTLLDGDHTVLDLQTELSRRSGQLVYREQVEAIVDQLDDLLFLDNERFHSEKKRIVSEFRAERIRRPAHAGAGYPDSAEELKQLLGSFYADPSGAGFPEAGSQRPMRAIIAPHIDLRLGGATYTHAYRRLGESFPADVFVILGIGHMGLPHFFSVGRKDFQTPLGIARCDREFVAGLDRLLGPETFAEELSHRYEHTIEFQVLFLQHLYPGRSFGIVPILTSFSYEALDEPDRSGEIGQFSSALRELTLTSDRTVCVIVSVDLAHLGPRYGDSRKPDTRTVKESLAADRDLLAPVLAGDADEFLRRIRAEEDRRRICGFSAIYTLLRTFPELKGELLSHSYCQIDDSGSVVSYASLAFPA